MPLSKKPTGYRLITDNIYLYGCKAFKLIDLDACMNALRSCLKEQRVKLSKYRGEFLRECSLRLSGLN